jgi:hypothetical protein
MHRFIIIRVSLNWVNSLETKKMTVFWYVAPCSLLEIDRRFRGAYCFHHQGDKIALMIEAVNTSKTLANLYETTRCNIPEDGNFHTRRHENLKSHLVRKLSLYLICAKPDAWAHSLPFWRKKNVERVLKRNDRLKDVIFAQKYHIKLKKPWEKRLVVATERLASTRFLVNTCNLYI